MGVFLPKEKNSILEIEPTVGYCCHEEQAAVFVKGVRTEALIGEVSRARSFESRRECVLPKSAFI